MSRELSARAALSTTERADQADTLADGDRKLGIRAAAAGDEDSRFLQRIGVRQLRYALAARTGKSLHRGEARSRAARADPRGGGEPPHDPLGRRTLAEIASASAIGAALSSRSRAVTAA